MRFFLRGRFFNVFFLNPPKINILYAWVYQQQLCMMTQTKYFHVLLVPGIDWRRAENCVTSQSKNSNTIDCSPPALLFSPLTLSAGSCGCVRGEKRVARHALSLFDGRKSLSICSQIALSRPKFVGSTLEQQVVGRGSKKCAHVLWLSSLLHFAWLPIHNGSSRAQKSARACLWQIKRLELLCVSVCPATLYCQLQNVSILRS